MVLPRYFWSSLILLVCRHYAWFAFFFVSLFVEYDCEFTISIKYYSYYLVFCDHMPVALRTTVCTVTKKKNRFSSAVVFWHEQKERAGCCRQLPLCSLWSPLPWFNQLEQSVLFLYHCQSISNQRQNRHFSCLGQGFYFIFHANFWVPFRPSPEPDLHPCHVPPTCLLLFLPFSPLYISKLPKVTTKETRCIHLFLRFSPFSRFVHRTEDHGQKENTNHQHTKGSFDYLLK